MDTKTFKSKMELCNKGKDLIEYRQGISVVLAYEFNIFNLGEEDVEIKFNEDGDVLILEPSEGFSTAFPLTHVIINTDNALVKYSYWI